MGVDWFRRQSWSQEDQTEFWHRLRKAREQNRPQYVFIQGFTLLETGPQYYASAIKHFDYVIDRYSDSIRFVQALSAKADCLAASGDIEGALAYYERAIQTMRIKPNNQTWAWLDFVWIVATNELSNYYETALAILDEFGSQPPLFPVTAFRFYGSRALIQSACGLTDSARNAARTALAAADKEVSGLRYHPKLGVIGSSYRDIRERLAAIV
ncbi:tol-pal system YbgF family protein [Bradyrhizobium sp. th.b2]|uniref:tetratricopeptide repeat protein n=1 Tax=Bradyrhizobium sp. th-b2 TaxID=172088 RepID=UPI00048DEAAF|nr:tetratricopeptide repeat protein [Bradyrhizobium sp. th.b2]